MGTYASARYVLGKTWAVSGYKAYAEEDLGVWTRLSTPAIEYSIVEVNKNLAISAYTSSSSTNVFYMTTDGINWSSVTTPSSYKYGTAAATSDGTFYIFQYRILNHDLDRLVCCRRNVRHIAQHIIILSTLFTKHI
jgi:hypothetical protein